MRAFLYTAVKTQNDFYKELNGHITTTFTEVNKKLPKVCFSGFNACGTVVGIEYWEEPKVTVAIIDCPKLHTLHGGLIKSGLSYEYEFIPHITLTSGEDKTKDFLKLIDEEVLIYGEYVGTFVRE